MNEPLLFLPGMMCDARIFMPQISAFSASHTLMIGAMTQADNFTELAENILDTAPPKFALAGLSMGGIAAMEIARLAPERVSKLALLDTNPLADPPDKSAVREEQIAKVKNGRLREVIRDEMKPHYLADGPQQADILSLCMEMAEDLGAEVFIRQSRALQTRRDQRDTLRKISAPTLILCGAEDTLCPPERHELMQNLISGSDLSVISGAGHLPTLEQPEKTNKEMKQWLMR